MRNALFGVPLLAVCCAVGALSPAASAQVFYEPVQYQYTLGDGRTFYYGGSNPAVFDAAHRRLACVKSRAELDESRFGYGVAYRGLIGEPPQRVYTDCLGAGREAYLYGYTSVDARNEANANVPTYYRKGDLIRGAVLDHDGTLVVPAQAPAGPPSMMIRSYRTDDPTTKPLTQPATKPKAIIIIPKKRIEPAAQPTKAAIVSVK